MCGISALISASSRLDPDHIREMGRKIRHRGPDDEGYVYVPLESGKDLLVLYSHDTQERVINADLPYSPKISMEDLSEDLTGVFFGHRRLSIIDLSPTGHQPMSYQDGRYWITYNGEIYNYLEVRNELIAKGYHFISHSDTEVILAAYAQWGKKCLERLNGMWSFLIYDRKEQVLFGSRDRFGIKPLYYWFSPEGFVAFSSEIKAFTHLPGWNPRINSQRVYDFLVHGLGDHTHETMFADVFQIRGGQAFEIHISALADSLPVYRWYHLPGRTDTGTEDEAIIRFRELLSEAVRIHMRSDVQIGSCLSGGLDSSSIVSIMSKYLAEIHSEDNLSTFSACSTDPRWDERKYVEIVLAEKKITGHYCYPDLNDLFQSLDDLIWHQDEPFRSTSIFAQWVVMKLAKENSFKVLIDGQGSDELIAGYHSFISINQADLLLRFHWIRCLLEIFRTKSIHGTDIRIQIRDLGYFFCETTKIGRIFLERRNRHKLEPSWLNLTRLSAKPVLPPIIRKKPGQERVSAYCEMATFSTILPFLLHFEDRNSMAHSVESRVPFLDFRFAEFLLSVRPEWKIRDGVTKKILREAMDGIIPDLIRDRTDKLGFATPEEAWMRSGSSILFREELERAIDSSDGVLNEGALTIFDDMINRKEPFNEGIWRMIILGKWMNRFAVRV